jgi:hypothetical protein
VPHCNWVEMVDLRKTIVNTETCQAPHLQYHVSGPLRVRMDDGSEDEFGSGELSLLPPGHDAWVMGNEPVVVIDISGMAITRIRPKPVGSTPLFCGSGTSAGLALDLIVRLLWLRFSSDMLRVCSQRGTNI